MPDNQSQAYQLKSIRYRNTPTKILLQNENGPCPLLAAANALLLRGVITLDPVCVRTGVASTDDVVNMLANRALTAGGGGGNNGQEAKSQTMVAGNNDRSSHHEYHVNEVLSLLPNLQHGMDVNPKFASGPTGVEYTNNLAAFDLLGVELVHGWLLDPQDVETASVVESRTYNELIETVIHGNEARDAVQKLEADLMEKQQLLEEIEALSHSCKGKEVGEDDNEVVKAGENSEQAGDSEAQQIPDDEAMPGGRDGKEGGNDNVEQTICKNYEIPGDASTVQNSENATTTDEQTAIDSDVIPGIEESKEGNKPEIPNAIVGAGEEANGESNNEIPEQCSGDLLEGGSSCSKLEETDQSDATNAAPSEKTPAEVTDQSGLRKEILEMRDKMSDLSLQISKSEVANAFLSSSGHQLTYHGLEQLHNHLGNDVLCVFFRNNHFATLTKHDGVLYLLATDLGYANTPEIVWEKLDNIDGATDYVNEFFAKPKPRTELTPASGPTIAPELLLAQRSQAESDFQLALAMSKGAATPGRIDDDEGKLIEAAKELSLKTYNGDDGATIAVDNTNIGTNNASTSSNNGNSRIDSDMEVAMAYQRAQQQSEHESEQLARQLQELEYARQRPAQGNTRRRPARAAAPSAQSSAASSNCIIS